MRRVGTHACLAVLALLALRAGAQDAVVTAIPAPDPKAQLLDLGQHFRVKLAKEGVATPVQLKLRRDRLGAVDIDSLGLARFDPQQGYRLVPEVKAEALLAGRTTLDRSGDYSLVALPADPVAQGALKELCGLTGRPGRTELDPICKVILCPAFEELGSFGGEGFPPQGGGGTGGDVCERCLGVGRPTAELAECGLFPGGFDPPIVIDPRVPRPLLPVCQRRPSNLADPSDVGPFAVGSTEYKFVDAFNIPPNDPNLDVWATVRYPGASAGANVALAAGSEKFPLVVYLHGNHGTFVSGTSHVCSPTATPVPNHEGYNYVLERLASQGFIAVSINANDLNCKNDRIVERGKLILEHLRRWKDFGDPTKPDPTFSGRFWNRVDMTRIGLAGHSRGGEAIVSAFLENKSAGLGFGIKALHSISPVDFKGFVLEDVPFYVLVGAADGDVSDLSGIRIYDRAAPRTHPDKMPKMQSHLYGANHNWFNTVWFQDEGSGPNRLTDVQQRAVERVYGVAFFREFLRGFSTARGLFTGTAAVAALAPAQVFRSYQDPAHRTVDDLEDAPANALANSLSGANTQISLAPFGEFPFTQGGAAFNSSFFHATKGLVAGWNAAADRFTLELPAAQQNVSSFRYLSFRMAQVFDNGVTNPVGLAQDLDVGLEDDLGTTHFLKVSDFDVIPFPYQRPSLVKTLLQTVRIGLPCFSCSGLTSLRATAVKRVHFRFNRKPAGLVGLDDVQFTR